MANPARDESMEDVLASIRRLVSEETERMPAMRDVAAQGAKHEPELDLGPIPESPLEIQDDPQDEALPEPEQPVQDQAPSEVGQGEAKSPRAKLLLTDDFLVEDYERWRDLPETETETEAEAEPEGAAEPDVPGAQPQPAAARSKPRTPLARSRRAYEDDAQDQVAEDIEGFLNAEDRPAQPAPAAPSLDERARARQERAERRRQASARAASIASDSAERRAPKARIVTPSEPQPAAAAKPAPNRAPAPQARAAKPQAAPAQPEQAAQAEPVKAPQPKLAQPRPRPQIKPRPAQAKPAAKADAPASQPPSNAGQMVPLSLIEKAVRASLEDYAEKNLPAPAPEPEGEVVLDEDTLRDMVSDIVRQELQGSLGERITRNVRKLVRREIYRALESRDLG